MIRPPRPSGLSLGSSILCVVLTAGCLIAWQGPPHRSGRRRRRRARFPRAFHSVARWPRTRRAVSGQLDRPPSPDQIEDYRANRDKSVVELQQFRELTRLTVDDFAGGSDVASLTDLNPQIGTWYLLRLETTDGPRCQLSPRQSQWGAPAARSHVPLGDRDRAEGEWIEREDPLRALARRGGHSVGGGARFPARLRTALRRPALPAQPRRRPPDCQGACRRPAAGSRVGGRGDHRARPRPVLPGRLPCDVEPGAGTRERPQSRRAVRLRRW